LPKHILDSIGDSRIFMLLVGVDISLEEHALMPLDLEPTSTVNDNSVSFYTVNNGITIQLSEFSQNSVRHSA